MDVYLVPIGADRLECYFEAPDDEAAAEGDPGRLGRLRARLAVMLREAEHARHRTEPAPAQGLLGRAQQRLLRWVVERVAEQRLLWHLRRETAAVLHAPDDLDAARAARVMRDCMKRDADRHRRLLVVHSAILVAVVPLTVLPGPNVIGYVFAFTVVGHYLAWRGARQGLTRVAWDVRPSADLTDLRGALALAPEARHRRVHEVADRLRLHRLATFVERMGQSTA